MPTVQSITASAFAQIQQLQAQHAAEQASTRARSLQDQARKAEAAAARAQEGARDLRQRSNAANNDAAQAQRSVASMDALNQTRTQLGDTRQQLQTALSSM